MRSISLRFIAGALVVPTVLQAQTESFGSLQFSMPKAVREQTADFVSVTDSSRNAVCRFVVLKQTAGANPDADYKAGFADMARIIGVPLSYNDPVTRKTLPSGYVLSEGGVGGKRQGGGGFTTDLYVYSGGGQRLTAFSYSTSTFRCLVRNTSFATSLTPLGSIVATAPNTGGGSPGAPSSAPASAPGSSPIPRSPAPQTSAPGQPTTAPATAPGPQNGGTSGGTLTPALNGPRLMSGWTYMSTTFNDGWTSSVKEDWVEGVKGNVMVRLHHPGPEDGKYYAYSDEERDVYWNRLIVPRYRNLTNVVKPQISSLINGYEPVKIAWADAVESATGRQVHVVLFQKLYRTRKDWNRWIEFVTPDRASFEQMFGQWHENMNYDPMAALHGLNRFSVAASDLNGEWTDRFQTYFADTYNIATGQYTGSLVNAFGDNLVVNGSRYQRTLTWHQMLNGVNRTAQDVWAGAVTVPDPWHVQFTGVKHAPTTRVLDAWFEAVKNGRVLVLDNTRLGKAR